MFDRDDLLDRAHKAILEGRVEEAAFLCKKVLSRDPSNMLARGIQAVIEAQLGRYAEAVAQFPNVLREAPDFFDGWIWLSISYGKLGRRDEALRAAIEAVQLRPEEGLALNNLGLCYLALPNFPEAIAAFQRAAACAPDSTEIAVNLGTALRRFGRILEAKESFKKAVASAQNSPKSYLSLGEALFAQHQWEPALDCAEKCVRGDPELPAGRTLLAKVLILLGRSEASKEHCLKAIELDPMNDAGPMLLASALETQGLNEEAAFQYRKAIDLRPNQGYAYLSLATGRHISASDSETISRMEELTHDQNLHKDEIKALHYGLGRVFESAKDYERSMRHYDEANRIGFSQTSPRAPFYREAHRISLEQTRELFSEDLFDQWRGIGLDSDFPIFIVGMMRSGTTLMEQILSRHPSVGAAGEQRFWTDNAQLAVDPQTRALRKDQLLMLANEYIAVLQDIAPGVPHVTDKMPANTIALGLIHLAFPNARIIHMNRNAADTCLSIYLTPNSALIDYAHNKENIAFAYRQHRTLMEHWRKVLPGDRLMDVAYEELVDDQERISRKVVEFCGLDWSDLCLSPENNERTVTTPSHWQVRQPVYKSSVERWRNFEPWIPEFRALLSL